ncbi:hypothetical protein PFAG_05568 [Plasmodium falciparum Santa Lucia]|uniref:Uncharacterized protein n=1 Tax=Plasmodium falciparum Santa Lucia TaxID=478859 RepID=W7FMC0_PLAFA|nr:hypothetical protein PFAG_05568 [Plasmodium falciparum Santa Lucia]
MYNQFNNILSTSHKKLDMQNNVSFKKDDIKKDSSMEHLNLIYPINSHMENTFDKYIKNCETYTIDHNKEEQQNMMDPIDSNSNIKMEEVSKEYKKKKIFLEMNKENSEELDTRVNRNYTKEEIKYDKKYDQSDTVVGYEKCVNDDTISYNKHFSDNILSEVTWNRFSSNISCYDDNKLYNKGLHNNMSNIYNDNMDIKTKNSKEFHINGIKRKSVSHNLSNICTSPCSEFFKYFRLDDEIFQDNKTKNNVDMINTTTTTTTTTNNNNNNNNNNDCFGRRPIHFFKHLNKHKVDVPSQTDNNLEDIFLNNIIHHENIKNLEIIWNNNEQKLKGESLILFLKNQIKMYKKELSIKNDEIKSIQNIHKKNIDDIISSHILEISKLKEKHQADIFFIKNQHLENIVSVRKNFESKLNHIEEDLFLDLDILYNEDNGYVINEQINQIIIGEQNEREKYGTDEHIDNFLNNKEIKKCDMNNNVNNSNDHINNNNNNNNNDDDKINNNNNDDDNINNNNNNDDNINNNNNNNYCYYYNNTLKCSERANNIRDVNYLEIKDNNNLMIYEKDKIKEHTPNNDILYNNISNEFTRNKDIPFKHEEHNLRNNIIIPHGLDDNPLKKLKFLWSYKNKEHEDNNKYIKEEMTHLKKIYNQVFLEKTKEYVELYVNNKIFYDILQYIEKDNNVVKEDILKKNNEHYYGIEEIKKRIYDIILKNNNESNTYMNGKKKEENEIVKELDENWLIKLLIYMNSLLQLERLRLEDMKIKQERNNGINNYIKNKNMKKKELIIDEEEELEEDISSNEIHRLEKEMDTNEKIKMLKEKNRKLLSLNEFYKKKLEHIQVWKTKLEIMKKNKCNEVIHNENNMDNKETIFFRKYKCEDDKGVSNKVEYTHNNNNNYSSDNNNNYSSSNNINYSSDNNNNNNNYSNNLRNGFTSIWFPLIYLKPVEEENKRDAELMYLLKMLGRYNNENKKNDIWSSKYEDNDSNTDYTKLINDTYNNDDNIFNFAYDENEYISCIKTENKKSTHKCYNDNENTNYKNINVEDRKDNFLYAPYNLLNVLKKKLTYIFWQLLGDIYKYRNVIVETCNYIYNIHNLFNEYINKYEKSEKKNEECYNKYMNDKEDDFLNEKYNLRKIIGVTKLKLEICTNEYMELKENYDKEKKRLIMLTNTCYENECMKYKNTIQQFKNVDKQLKIYKAREKKWINLVKLLILELKNSSKTNQEDIKNIWIEIISTKKEIINHNNIYMENNNTNDYFTIHKEDQGKGNNLLNDEKLFIQNINRHIDENNFPFEYNHDTSTIYNNNNIVKNNDDLIVKNNKTNKKENRNKKNIQMKEKQNDKINFYKKDFHSFLDDIVKSELFHFYSYDEPNNFITNKINSHIDMTSININTNEYYRHGDELYIDKDNMEDYNLYYNKKINHLYNNYILRNYNNNDNNDKNNNAHSNNIHNNNKHNNNAHNNNTHNNNAHNNNTHNNNTNNTTKHLSNQIKDKLYEGNDFFSLVSSIAKESCLIFQILLKIKEDDIKEKTEKITSLEKKLYLLKQYNINEKNKNKLLLAKQEILTNKINTLNIDKHKLQTHISSINKEKLHLKSHNLTKQQELNLIITYYKNIIISIQKHINKYSTVLHLLDNIPQHDKDIILNLTNNHDEKCNNLIFSLHKQQKDDLKTKNEFSDQGSHDSSIQQTNLQLLKSKSTNENMITGQD